MAPACEFGLLGFPLGHSLSPHLHQAALKAAGLVGGYTLYSIPPDHPKTDDQIKCLMERVVSGEIAGLNVTIPYKQMVIGYMDQLTPIAAQIEAVNTIFFKHGELVGDNTDVPGFLKDITTRIADEIRDDQAEANSIPDTALILGAGGSARAIVYALAMQGVRIILVSRRIEQAETLVESLEKKHLGIFKFNPVVETMSPRKISKVITDVVHQELLIVNTTPLGMWPKVDHSPWPETIKFPGQAMVYDLIYNPRETLLMRAGEKIWPASLEWFRNVG